MGRKALSDLLRIAILSMLVSLILAPMLAYMSGLGTPLKISPSKLNNLAQGEIVDLNVRAFANSSKCNVFINNLPLFTINIPHLEFTTCYIPQLNESWVSITRNSASCSVTFNPVFVERNATLILYNLTGQGWIDKFCVSRKTYDIRVYDLNIEYCRETRRLSGPVELKIITLQVNGC